MNSRQLDHLGPYVLRMLWAALVLILGLGHTQDDDLRATMNEYPTVANTSSHRLPFKGANADAAHHLSYVLGHQCPRQLVSRRDPKYVLLHYYMILLVVRIHRRLGPHGLQ
jgi:hypothetical protein